MIPGRTHAVKGRYARGGLTAEDAESAEQTQRLGDEATSEGDTPSLLLIALSGLSLTRCDL
jgi:hypothetical protein